MSTQLEIENFLKFFQSDVARSVARLDQDFLLSDGKINFTTVVESRKMIEPGATQFFKLSDPVNGQVLLGKSEAGWYAIAYDGKTLRLHLSSAIARRWYTLCAVTDLNVIDWLLAGEVTSTQAPAARRELAEAA